MNDVDASAALAASSWERMAAAAEAHALAMREADAAQLHAFLCPGPYADARQDVAAARLARAEGALKCA